MGDGSVQYVDAAEFANMPRAKKADDQPKIDATRIKIQAIQTAVQNYQIINGVWPNTVEQLTQPDNKGRPPALRVEDITDSWGNRIIIDHNQGDATRPLIYSTGPPGKNRKISNLDP